MRSCFTGKGCIYFHPLIHRATARMAKLVDAWDLKSPARKGVPVRFRLRAPTIIFSGEIKITRKPTKGPPRAGFLFSMVFEIALACPKFWGQIWGHGRSAISHAPKMVFHGPESHAPERFRSQSSQAEGQVLQAGRWRRSVSRNHADRLKALAPHYSRDPGRFKRPIVVIGCSTIFYRSLLY